MARKLEMKPISFFEKEDSFFNKNKKWLNWAILIIATVFSFLLANLRISEGGDDSTYIIKALLFRTEGKFPTYQGALYPMFLSLFMFGGGINLILLKFTSLVLMIIFFAFTIKTLNAYFSPTIFYTTFLFLSFNAYLLYFSSQTYSESFFLVLQSLFFYSIFNYINKENRYTTIKSHIQPVLIISIIILLMVYTRTIGYGALIATALFLLLTKRYKQTVLILASFTIIATFITLLKTSIWELKGGSEQLSSLLYKHPYDFQQGKETIGGFFMRFIQNSNLYLSKQYFKILGLATEQSRSINSIYTIIFYALFGFGYIKKFRKNDFLHFIAIYVIIMLGITFVILQTIWDQYRLIIPFVPFMIILTFSAIQEIIITIKRPLIKKAIYLFIGIIFTTSLIHTFNTIDTVALNKNLKGDKYYGYSPDWQNYLKMTEYCAKNLEPDSYVATRKPSMARIFGNGKPFYGIYRFQSENPDTLLQRLKDNNVTHVILGSLRKDPSGNTGQIINTMHRYVRLILDKYPNAFEYKHITGTKDQEPAYLFKVNYASTTQK